MPHTNVPTVRHNCRCLLHILRPKRYIVRFSAIGALFAQREIVLAFTAMCLVGSGKSSKVEISQSRLFSINNYVIIIITNLHTFDLTIINRPGELKCLNR